jgi:hypothetical protein
MALRYPITAYAGGRTAPTSSVEAQGIATPERPTDSPMKGPNIREEIAGVSDRGERATRVKKDEQQSRYLSDNVFQ